MKNLLPEATGAELARILAVSPASVSKALKKGRIQLNDNGKFTVEEAVRDWKNNTHPRHGGKRELRFPKDPEPGCDNPPLVNFWMDVVEKSYPLMALEFSQHRKMAPAKVWELLSMVFFMECCAVLKILGIPDDTRLEDAMAYKGLSRKLRQWPLSKDLDRWLVNQLKKEEGEPLDPSIWE